MGPEPVPRRQLTAGRLAAAIRTSLDDRRMRERSEVLGERIRAEDGVEKAVALIDGAMRRC